MQVLSSARLQLSNDFAVVIGKIVELLVALDEVGIPIKEGIIWPLAPFSREFIKTNLQRFNFERATDRHCGIWRGKGVCDFG